MKGKKKSKVALLLVLTVILTTVFPVSVFAEEPSTETLYIEQTEDIIPSAVESHTRLLVTSDSDLEDYKGALECIRSIDGLFILTYESVDSCELAYEQYLAEGVTVEYDESVAAINEQEDADVPEESEVVEEMARETTSVEETRDVAVAVIDTGADKKSEILKDRLIEGGDNRDVNGHGTLMSEIIAMNTSERVKILPMAAFDEAGVGSVSSVYLALNQAIEKDVDVINLSVSGLGHSRMLESAIQKAKSRGITVVVAAGNGAGDTKEYIPAHIDEAIVVSAVDTNKQFAEYSNHGATVDFSAVGSITEDDETFMGTSVSAAYVSSYVALILANNDKADVEACLKASAEDLGDEGRDDYYGEGFLCLDSIVSNINQDETENLEELPPSEDEDNALDEADGEQRIYTCTSEYEFYNALSQNGNATLYINSDIDMYNYGAFSVGWGTKYIYGNNHFLRTRHSSTTFLMDHGGELNFYDVLFDGMDARRYKGALAYINNGTANFSNCLFQHNYTSDSNYYCFGIQVGSRGTVRLYDSRFGSIDGAGIYNLGGSVSMKNTYMVGVKQGIENNGGEVTVCNSPVYESGIGYHNYAGGTLNVYGCNIYNCDTGLQLGSGNVTVQGWSNNGTNYETKIYNNGYGVYVYGAKVKIGGNTSYPQAVRIYNNTGYGIGTNGQQQYASTINIYSPTVIYSNGSSTAAGYFGAGIDNRAYSTINIHDGVSVYSNRVCGVHNQGTVNIKGGSFKKNGTHGIFNNGTGIVKQSGASVGENGTYDVYHAGSVYQMSGAATAYSKGVYLAAGKTIAITGALTVGDGAIKLTVADPNVGRLIATTTYAKNKPTAEAMMKKFSLQNEVTNTSSTTPLPNGKQKRSARLRPGNGEVNGNGAVGTIILSEDYYVDFKGNIDNPNISYSGMPTQKVIYWKEANQVPTGKASVLYKGEPFNSLENVSWNKKADGTGQSCQANQSMSYTIAESTKDHILYTGWNSIVNLNVDGNEQTTGDNYVIKRFVSNVTPLPDNTFAKLNFSFQGWSKSKSAVYKDDGVKKPAETMDFTTEVLSLLEMDNISVDTDGYADARVYVVWDEFPIITADAISVSVNDIDTLTDKKLLELGRVTATDREDGNLENGTDVKVAYCDRGSLKKLENIGCGSVTYVATDKVGNTSYRTVEIWVTQTNPVDRYIRETRFISRQYYDTHDETLGGLDARDKWYTDPEYVRVINECFDNLENDTPQQTWYFTHEQVLQVQRFIEVNGLGKFEREDALDRFYDTFKGCITQGKGVK